MNLNLLILSFLCILVARSDKNPLRGGLFNALSLVFSILFAVHYVISVLK